MSILGPAQPWAILCRHACGSEVGEHSATPCLVSGDRNVVSGHEPAVQGANRPVLLGTALARSTAAAEKPGAVLTIASRRSLMTELLRRETGDCSGTI